MKIFARYALAAALAFAAMPVAAQVTLPTLPSIGPSDVFPIVPGASPGPTSHYVKAPQLTAQYGYVKLVPLTGFTSTFGNSQSYLELNPAGTLATGTVTLAPAPSDGSKECIFSSQTITSLTVNANTGQSINNAVTTLSANTGVCYLYSASNTTWDRT